MKRRKQRLLNSTEVSINREADYIIDGERFTVTMMDGSVRVILGYPTREIENTIRKGR